MTDPDRWLGQRLAAAPASLRARIETALGASTAHRSPLTPDTMADRLRSTAESLMREAQDGPPTHDTALTLLAADALVTLACEWVAETEPEKLGELR